MLLGIVTSLAAGMKFAARLLAFVLGWLLVLGAGLPARSWFSEQVARLPTAPSVKFPDSRGSDRPPLEVESVKSPEITIMASETSAGQKPFDELVKGAQRLEGLFTLYRTPAGKLYIELQPQNLNVNYFCSITLESGVGEQGFLSGMPLADFLFTFRRVNDRVQFTIPNVYFRTLPSDPMRRAVQRSFSSSVLEALPIRSTHPTRKSLLLELDTLLLSDVPGLSQALTSTLNTDFTLDKEKSYLGTVKALPLNVELETVYGFSGGNVPGALPAFLVSVPDSRSFNLKVRYSFSQLPTNNGYRPRLADDRVGYFITAYQNLSDDSPQAPFVRYINRWHLEKQDPNAPLSPPKQPIVFWIENTVPLEYRAAVREGVLMWNKAFEQAGFVNAIEVRQMPDQATWDPADIRYNTIRWISTFEQGLLGIGPSRVNPLTGQILDADILINAGFARYIKQEYRSVVQQNPLPTMQPLAKLTRNPQLCGYGLMAQYLKQTVEAPPPDQRTLARMGNYDLCYGLEASRQLAIGATTLSMLHQVPATSPQGKQFVQDFLRTLVAHEVGHTLGLRHNFRASAMLSPEQLNDPTITQQKGLIGSVMDYAAVNLAPPGTPQGDYFTQTIGPYDAWAIEYGYKPSPAPFPLGNPARRSVRSELPFLNEIARRAAEPELAYATDEDTFAELDPQTLRFDLSRDLLTYAPWQFQNAQLLWQRLDRQQPIAGESFNDMRLIFDEIFEYYFQYAYFLTTYIGGQSFNRYRGGDAVGKLPFESVAITQQQQALSLLQQYVLSDRAFQFSPDLVNKLAPSRWNHWGEMPEMQQLDYPIYDRILLLQSVILRELLGNDRLARLRDGELRSANQTLKIPDLFNFLQTSIWGEVIQPTEPLRLSSLRRGLQREYLNQLVRMVLRKSRVPEDARSMAWYELKQLRGALDTTLKRHAKDLDVATRAHLEESSDRIAKALAAELQSQ